MLSGEVLGILALELLATILFVRWLRRRQRRLTENPGTKAGLVPGFKAPISTLEKKRKDDPPCACS